MWRVFVNVWIQAPFGGCRGGLQKVFVHVKRSITFIISCQFQTGLRILKTLFDLFVSIHFFSFSLGRKRIRTVCGLYLDVCDDTVTFLFLMSFPSAINQTLPQTKPPKKISDLVCLMQWKIALKRYYMGFCPVFFFF